MTNINIFSKISFMSVNIEDCGLYAIRFIHNIFILGTLCLSNFPDRVDHFRMLVTKNDLFQLNINLMDHLRRNLKTLPSSLAPPQRYYQSMRLVNKAKSSEEEAHKCKYSILVILVYESKKEEKVSLDLLKIIPELVIDKTWEK